MTSEPRYIRRRAFLKSNVLCVGCGGYMAQDVDFLCDGCAFERSGVPQDNGHYLRWKELQELVRDGYLPWGRTVSEEALEVAEKIVREVFGDKEVERLSEFKWDQFNDNAADREYEQRRMISGAAKESLAKDDVTFEITNVRLVEKGTGKLKQDTYFLDIVVDKELCSLAFGADSGGKRKLKLAGLADHFQQPASTPVKARLRMYDTNFGNPGFDIEGV
jgi:hypothetical protein